VLALYDRDERRDVDEPGMRREVADGVVRLVDVIGTRSMVAYSHLEESAADRAIRHEAEYFGRLGHRVEWKLYAHDEPKDLQRRLVVHGFEPEDQEAIMVLDLAAVPPQLLQPPGADIRQVADVSRLQDFLHVNNLVWPEKTASTAERLRYLLRSDPSRVSVYVAYVRGEPVSAARTHFSSKSAFASIWGGATVPEYRGRGLYTALLAARVQEARRRGARFVTIDAGPMSRPIVEKHGFRLLTYAQAHLREAAQPTAP
jgi:GNAT superfamily N-acetyltransferase